MVSSPPLDAGRLSTPPTTASVSQSGPIHPVASASRMAYLRDRYRGSQLSEEAVDIMLHSWRAKTNKSYDSLFRKWHRWCCERSLDPISGPIADVVNFLASLHTEGYSYSSVNSYRSAISSVHEQVDGYDAGKHPLVMRALKGVYHDRPPLPRYTSTWNVNMVLDYLVSLGDNPVLSLKQLTWKVTMLLALTRPTRSVDLSMLSISARQHRPNGVAFLPDGLANQSRQGKPLAEFFFPSLPDNSTLCTRLGRSPFAGERLNCFSPLSSHMGR